MSTRSMSALPIAFVTALAIAACSSSTTEPGNNPPPNPPPNPPSTVTGVSVSATPNPAKLTVTVNASAVVKPSSASQSVTWTSSDATIATVDAGGLVTLRLHGKVTITATSTADKTRSGSVELMVVCPDPRLVSANIRSATTWENWIPDPGCFDYVVQADINTPTEVLTIEPGTVVGFEEGRGMRIATFAALIAEGTAKDPIVLTGTTAQRGWWKGVSLEGLNESNVLRYVTVEYTGNHHISGSEPASLILIGKATARVEHSTFQQSLGYGVSLSSNAKFTGDGGNSFTKNALGAAWAYGTAVPNLNKAVLTGNDVDVVVVFPNSITVAATWPTATYHVIRASPQSFYVGVGGELTLSPGSTLRFEGDQTLLVQGGGLSAIGTAEAPIVFTGTEQVRGHWGGIGFVGTDLPMNRLEHVIVEYGGGRLIGAGAAEMANVVITRGGSNAHSRVTIQNSTLRESGEYGLWVRRDSKLTSFTGNTLTRNKLGPAYVHAPVVGELLESNEYDGNDKDEVVVETGPTLTIDKASTWKDLGVPFYLQYPMGSITVVTAPLTIEPGVEMLMKAGLTIQINQGGTLTAIGTTNNRITMRSKTDAWRGISFLNTTGSFDYIDIKGAGSGAWGSGYPAGTVAILAAAAGTSAVSFTGNVTLTGSGHDIVFGHGKTYAGGCPGSVWVPPPDKVGDHCRAP